MSGTDLFRDQKGSALLSTLMFIIFIGIISASVVTLVVSDSRMLLLNIGERRAFYAAISGLEYATRAINEYAAANTSINSLHNYTETVSTGDGSTCEIILSVIGTDSVLIDAKGISATNSKRLQKGYNFIDVSKYAVYSAGSVTNVRTVPAGSIVQNATIMPFFDMNALRDLSNPTNYYSGNLTVNGPFSVTRPLAFVEGDLSLQALNFLTIGNFTSMGSISLQPWLFNFSRAIFYQPTSGQNLTCSMPVIFGYFIDGGIISNGNVTGYNKPWWAFWILNFSVTHDRDVINSLLQYTVNGGPLIYTSYRTDIIH